MTTSKYDDFFKKGTAFGGGVIIAFVLLFLLSLLFGGCALFQSISNQITTGNSSGIPTPGVGQWVDYGGSEPAINGNSFAFPAGNGSVVAGYFYTQLPVIPKVGQTLTINYTVTGVAPVWQNAANGGDSGAPTLHVFLWRKGDNLSCTNAAGGASGGNGGYADYRLFAGRTPLVLGANQTISVPLDAAHFTNCWGVAPANISDELNNLLGAGITFGGQSFAGHGIYLSSGSATFTINSFTVQ